MIGAGINTGQIDSVGQVPHTNVIGCPHGAVGCVGAFAPVVSGIAPGEIETGIAIQQGNLHPHIGTSVRIPFLNLVGKFRHAITGRKPQVQT